ncbi:MAG: hypothetical protein KAJ75_05080, partial [Alphaproteobacteria bacterium]|nr:hypothetical protein [Alphaproteobacteria bacterium]
SNEVIPPLYIYLKPSSKKGCDCKQVNENVVLEKIEDVLKNMAIPENVLVMLKETLKNSLEAKKDFQIESIKLFRKQEDKIDTKLNNLLDMRLEQSITKNVYDNKALALRTEKHNLRKKIENHDRADEEFSITLNYLLDLASRSHNIFKSSGIDTKRKIINLVFSNLTLDNKKLEFSLQKPFDVLVNLPKRSGWLGNLDSNQD